jgi:dTDP-4-amino-4,6-dideoxygalactose transaminase
MIDNSNRAVWTASSRNGIIEFPSPFEQNKPALSSIDHILKKESIYNVPKYNITVFTQKRVAFKIRTEHLTTADRLIETIKDINSNKFLNTREINRVISAIGKYSSK